MRDARLRGPRFLEGEAILVAVVVMVAAFVVAVVVAIQVLSQESLTYLAGGWHWGTALGTGPASEPTPKEKLSPSADHGHLRDFKQAVAPAWVAGILPGALRRARALTFRQVLAFFGLAP